MTLAFRNCTDHIPVSELLAIVDDIGPAQDVQIRAKSLTVLASCMSWPTACAMLRQMSPQFDRLTIGRIHKLVDRLVADRDRKTLEPHPARNLLWRPGVLNQFDDRLAYLREARELP